MAQTRLSKKRKAGVVDAAPPLDDDELAGVVLDGVLSASEGEEDGEYDLEEDADEDDEGEDEDDEDDEDEDDEDDEDEVEDDKDEDDEDDEEDDKNENEDNKTTLTHRSKIPSDNDADIPNYRTVTDANGGVRYEYNEIDPVYDSDDTDAQSVAGANTIGNIPLSFYDSYPHIGYDINGKRIMRPAAGDALDALLDSIEVPAGWTGLTDPATGKPLELSRDELELLRRLQMNEVPEDGFDPYPVRCVSLICAIYTALLLPTLANQCQCLGCRRLSSTSPAFKKRCRSAPPPSRSAASFPRRTRPSA